MLTLIASILHAIALVYSRLVKPLFLVTDLVPSATGKDIQTALGLHGEHTVCTSMIS